MCEPTTVMVLMAASGAMSAYSQYQQGMTQGRYYNYMADQSRIEGKAALDRAGRQSELIQDSAKYEGMIQAEKSAEFTASQKAAMVANGVDLGSGSASDIIRSSMSKEKMDEAAIRYNAEMKSWATMEEGKIQNWQSNIEANNYNFAAKQAKSAGKTSAAVTLLGTAASMGFAGYQMGMFGGASPATSAAGYSSAASKAGLSTKPWLSQSSGYARAFR